MRLLIFLLAILIPACASSSLAFHMMYSAYKLSKQVDNVQTWCTLFPICNQSIVPCLVLQSLRFVRHPPVLLYAFTYFPPLGFHFSIFVWCIFVLQISIKVSFPQMSKPRFSFLSFLILIDWSSCAWSQTRHEGFSIFVVACGIFSCSMWDLVPSPGMKLWPSALGAWSLSHWATGEVPDFPFLNSYYVHSTLL